MSIQYLELIYLNISQCRQAHQKEILDSVHCQYKIILIDACHSGESSLFYKKTGGKLSFSSDSPAVQALISRSRGIVFGAACRHDQSAYISKDGRTSIWIGSIIEAINTYRSLGGFVFIDQVLFDAVRSTIVRAQSEFGKEQTPYTAIKAEGVLGLGHASGRP